MTKRQDIINKYKDVLESGLDEPSLGDVLGFTGGSESEHLIKKVTSDKGLPVLVGLRSKAHPEVLDLSKHSAVTILGASGSGKSRFVNSLILNLLITNTEKELNLYLAEQKQSVENKSFSKFPQVKGHATNQEELRELVTELNEELQRRKDFIYERGLESVTEYREQGGEMPQMVVVLEDFTNSYLEMEKNLEIDITYLTAVGRVYGITVVFSVQSVKPDSYPDPIKQNSSLKVMFKCSDEESKELFSDLLTKNDLTKVGEFYLKEKDEMLMKMKTLPIGGSSVSKQLEVIEKVQAV